MVAIAKHEQTEEMVISDTYASSLEIKSKYPGKFLCYFCNGELYPVKAGFRKHRCGNLELEIFHRTHFRHAEGNSQYCVKSRGQSLEHIISLKFWQKKLSTASQEHFKSAVTIVYEPLLKGIDATGRPDLGLMYQDKVIGGCEVQISRIGEHLIVQRSNDHLSLGMSGSWWAMTNCPSHYLENLLRLYDSAYTLQMTKQTQYVSTIHPTLGNYLMPIEVVDKVDLTQWQPGQNQDTIVPDEYYAQFIDSMFRGNRTFPCHNKYVQLSSVKKVRIQGQGKKDLVPLSQLSKENFNLKGIEIRDSESHVLGVLQKVDGDLAAILTLKGDAIVPLNFLYVDQNIVDECVNTEDKLREQAAIAQNLRAKQKEVRDVLIENSTTLYPIPNQLILSPSPQPQLQQTQPLPQLQLLQQKPRTNVNIGTRVRWKNAPYYWGTQLSKVVGVTDDSVFLEYWKDAIPIDEIEIVQSLHTR